MLHLVHPLGFRTDDKYLKRAGLDYWDFVKIKHWDSLDNFLEIHALDQLHYLSKKATTSYLNCAYSPGDFLIFGKETKGLPSHILEQFPAQCFRVPILNSNIRSLNLAMTCGIVLYEAMRQIDISK